VVSFALGEKPEAGMAKRPTPEQRDARHIGVATGLAGSIVATLVLCIGGGVWLDRHFGTLPVLTLIGVALGLAAAAYQLWELTKLGSSTEQAGPVSRQFARLSGPPAAQNLREQGPDVPERERGNEE
jgi:ATP synthase protein I